MTPVYLSQEEKGKDNKNALIVKSKLDALLNEQRMVELEISHLQNQIHVLQQSIADAGSSFALKDINNTPKIRQVDAEILELRKKYEAELRQKEAEKKKLLDESHLLQLQSKKKQTSMSIDEIKLKNMLKMLSDKEADHKKREISIRTLKVRLN